MQNLALDAITAATGLLKYYSHDAQEQTQQERLDHWLRTYPVRWVRLALIEALYQGRYKTVSVEQLLAIWRRRGQPLYHFNPEFELLVCHDFPQMGHSTLETTSEQRQLAPAPPISVSPLLSTAVGALMVHPETLSAPDQFLAVTDGAENSSTSPAPPRAEAVFLEPSPSLTATSGFFSKLRAIAKHQTIEAV
jgi:hypothetical protein